MPKLAAIQLETRIGDPAQNIAMAERAAIDAFEQGAEYVGLPEFFTGAVVPCPQAYRAVLPAENPAIEMLKRLATRYRGVIGGSMLLADGADVYNRYVLAEPDGSIHTHDKDLPTMWENAFYIGGTDDGVFDTAQARIGAAVCWELIRTQTVQRMAGRIDLAMTGTHWWTLADNWGAAGRAFGAIGQYNRYLSENAPAEFARRLGVPVLQASHCGAINGAFRLLPGTDINVPYSTCFVAATQIVDATGSVLASRPASAGPGLVTATVELGSAAPVEALDTAQFWIPKLPLFVKAYWHQQNVANRSAYRRHGREAGLAAAASYDGHDGHDGQNQDRTTRGKTKGTT